MPVGCEMTEERAKAVLLQIDIMKKRGDHGWNWERVEINKHAEACVICTFNVGTPTVEKWFKKATANAFRIERQIGTPNWKVWFDLIPVEMESF